MGLQWTADIRNQVSLLLLQHPYASMRADEQERLDGAVSSGSLPIGIPDKGVARESLMRLRQIAQWYEEAGVVDTTGSTTGPSVWEPVLIQECAYHLAQSLRPMELGRLRELRAESWANAINNYGVNSIADSSQMFGVSGLTPQRIRLHVLRCMARRQRRIMPPVAEIDFAIEWAINRLWECRVSLYRARHVIITIPTASEGQTPTYTLVDGTSLPSGEVVDSIISPRLCYSDTDGRNSLAYARWGLAEEFTSHRAAQGTETGRPQLFRVEQRGSSTLRWIWSPAPDQEYTAQAIVMVKAPTTPSAATDTAVLAKFPLEYKTLIMDLVLAKVLAMFNVDGWQEDWRLAQKSIDDLLAGSEQVASTPAYAATDVYRDQEFQAGAGPYGGV